MSLGSQNASRSYRRGEAREVRTPFAQNPHRDRALPQCRAEAGACGAAGSAASCRPQRASRALSTDARLSIQARASPITAAVVVGELRRACGRTRAMCCFRRRRSSESWAARPGSSFVVLSGRGGQRSAVAQLRRPGPPNPPQVPTIIAEETKRADLTQLRELDRRYAFAELTLRRLDVPVLVARDELGRQVGAGSRQPPSDCPTRGSLRARGRRLFGGDGALGECS